MITEPSRFKTPGQLITSLLDERGWTNRTLSVVLAIDEQKVSRLASDRQPTTADIAVLLEEVFSVDASVFLALQCSYDLAMARVVAQPDPKRKTRAAIHHGLPLADMIKRGWINAKDVRDPRIEEELVRFFGANRVEDIEILPHSAKKTEVSEPVTPAQLAWLYRVRKISGELLVARYSQEALAAAVVKLRALLISSEAARNAPRILAEAGVRFLVVESLPGDKIDGVCFWLNDRSPVIAVTMRFDRIDNFWFVLRHEIEHVLQGHGRDKEKFMLDLELAGDTAAAANIAEEERIANEAAADFCVSRKMMDAFIARKAPFFHDRDILAFAKMINVHPGLIAGQIRHRTNNYMRFQNYLEKIRSAVLPGAVVDGWGSVYPIEQ
jgi:HTH-type transcriptional regulator/antitoxin HigA